MKLFVLTAALLLAQILPGALSALEVMERRARFSIAEVSASAVDCLVDRRCRSTSEDSADSLPLAGASGEAVVEARLRPIGAASTSAEGLYLYEYRLDLRTVSGSACVSEVQFDFGLPVPIDYDGDGVAEYSYVVSDGAGDGVVPTGAASNGRTLRLHFDPPLCAGERSYRFGAASVRPPRLGAARLLDRGGSTHSVAVQAPDLRPSFVRGDADSNGEIELSDGMVTLNYLFSGATAPGCLDAADLNASGSLELTDAIALFDWLFLGGDEPPAPSPSAPAYEQDDCTFEEGSGLGCELQTRACRARDLAELYGLIGTGEDGGVIRVQELPEERTAEEEPAPAEETPPPELPVDAVPIEDLPPVEELPTPLDVGVMDQETPAEELPTPVDAVPVDHVAPQEEVVPVVSPILPFLPVIKIAP